MKKVKKEITIWKISDKEWLETHLEDLSAMYSFLYKIYKKHSLDAIYAISPLPFKRDIKRIKKLFDKVNKVYHT